MAKLQLQNAVRQGKQLGGGAYKSERKFLDILIDGISLWELCKQEGIDNISCIWQPDIYKPAVERLLLQLEPDLPDDRYSIYVCAECGDIGCGAVSVRIEQTDNQIVWRDFAYQNNYDDSMTYSPDSFSKVDPSVFDLAEYRQLLLPLIQ